LQLQLWVVGCDFEDYRDLVFVQGWHPNIKGGRVATVETQNDFKKSGKELLSNFVKIGDRKLWVTAFCTPIFIKFILSFQVPLATLREEVCEVLRCMVSQPELRVAMSKKKLKGSTNSGSIQI